MYDTHHQTKLSHRQVPANCADEMAEHGRRENTFSTTKGPTDKSTDAFAGVTIQFLVSQALAVCISSALLILVECRDIVQGKVFNVMVPKRRAIPAVVPVSHIKYTTIVAQVHIVPSLCEPERNTTFF